MYKYAINTRGRKIRVEDKYLKDLIEKGFVEISKEEFDGQSYIGVLDQKTTIQKEVIKEKGFFKTKIV